jgi:hypothetical protein
MKTQKLINFSIVILAFSLMNCSSVKSQASKNSDEKHEEDLSSYRPKYVVVDSSSSTASNKKKEDQSGTPVVPQKDITKDLNRNMDTMAVRNSAIKTAQGYRVLVYSGKSSEEVKKVKDKVYALIPAADIYIDFKPPNQRVEVGNCLDRQEAYNLLGKLKKSFGNAVIVPGQIILKAK